FGIALTQAATAWDVANGAGTVVAVVDTGIDETHPDLAANVWTNPGEIPGNGLDDDGNGHVDDVHGWDFADGDATPHDLFGHGTHVAGTIAAVGDNARGVVGMAWGARVMPVRGFDANGSGTLAGLAACVVYAAENGADVINNSWGSIGVSHVVSEAAATAESFGAVMVAAAGNFAAPVDDFEPAVLPGVVAVGATDYLDRIAGFSDFGAALSVAAPGVDVLSLRAGVILPSSPGVVGTDYLRLSGTSMATPHVSGLAAVLLSAQPTLTADEVRWHLELNADQPGIPGYEGQPWNPYYGWGRINAGRVFDPVPATTRTRPRGVAVHAYAGASNPDVGTADLEFTTLTPLAWTLTPPPWLVASATAGTGPEHLSFSLDATGLAPGALAGTVVIAAPAAADAGTTLGVAAELHQDVRAGNEATVAVDVEPSPELGVATDGVGTLVVWSSANRIYAARSDGSGTFSTAVELVPGPFAVPSAGEPDRFDLDVASDGRDFLVAWVESTPPSSVRSFLVKVLRVGPDGQALDTVPTVVESRRLPRSRTLLVPRVAADSAGYTVLWDEFDSSRPVSRINFRRVGRDGTLRSRRRKLYPGVTPGEVWPIDPRIACVADGCLVAWKNGHPLRSNASAFGVRVKGDKVVDGVAHKLLDDVADLVDVRSDGSGYAILTTRVGACPGAACGPAAVAGTVTADNVPTDLQGTRLDVDPTTGHAAVEPVGLAHDGTNWIATFLWNHQIFGTRLAPDGTRLDAEPVGLLLSPTTAAGSAAIAATRTDTRVVWQAPQGIAGDATIRAQRVLPHAPDPTFPAAEIGAIGPRGGMERAVLGLTLAASGLAPATTMFGASNLPRGAVFDAPTRTFRWVPAADQAGTYPGVHFQATDGVTTVQEDVTLTVAETVRSIGGTATLAGGGPAPLVPVRLSGAPGGRRIVHTDVAGRYRFDDLAPGAYAVRLDSSKTYVAAPPSTSVVVGAADVHGVDMAVTPR
ncbi:MAG: S8 family serine peptidase, partial [Candidatus Binatia bacterium]